MKYLAAAVFSAGLFGLPLACGSDTGRSRVEFDVEMGGLGGAGPFDNEHGWSVTLTKATVDAGPLYFYEGAPLFTRVLELFVSTAYAHPGHYVEGDALGDFLERATVDLLASEPVLLGKGNGVTGSYNSARFEGRVVELEGSATKDGQTIDFSGTFTLEGPIEGIAFGAEVTANGKIQLLIDAGEWVRRVDFSLLATPSFERGTQPFSAFERGIEKAGAYHFSWIE